MVSLPPRCARNVRSLTRPISTPGTARISSTSAPAWSTPRAAHVTSTRTRSAPDAVTSSAVTRPPPRSITVVSSLTAVGRAGSSSRTVIEYDTLGADAMAASRLGQHPFKRSASSPSPAAGPLVAVHVGVGPAHGVVERPARRARGRPDARAQRQPALGEGALERGPQPVGDLDRVDLVPAQEQ